MNPQSAIYQYHQYYPTIPFSREILFTCGCRFFREELKTLSSRQRLCPVHGARVYQYIFTCCDCGRAVYKKKWTPGFVCKPCGLVRKRVYTKLYGMGCFEFEDDNTDTSFQIIGKKLGIKRQFVAIILGLAIAKLRENKALLNV